MFNLQKQAKQETKHTDQMLDEQNSDYGFNSQDNSGNIDRLLKKRQHKNKDNTKHYEMQLDEARTADTGDRTLEGKLDKDKTVYNQRRLDKAYSQKIKHQDMVAEAHDQAKYEAYREVDGSIDQETMFWDKYVGTDVPDKKTKIVSNQQKSQLANHPDRFKGLNKTTPVNEQYKDDASAMTKTDKMYDLVSASLKDADAMLFQLYASAARENRDLNEADKESVNNINAGKAKMLAFANGEAKEKFVISKDGGKVEIWERFFRKANSDMELKEKKIEEFDSIEEARKAHSDVYFEKTADNISGTQVVQACDVCGKAVDNTGMDTHGSDGRLYCNDCFDIYLKGVIADWDQRYPEARKAHSDVYFEKTADNISGTQVVQACDVCGKDPADTHASDGKFYCNDCFEKKKKDDMKQQETTLPMDIIELTSALRRLAGLYSSTGDRDALPENASIYRNAMTVIAKFEKMRSPSNSEVEAGRTELISALRRLAGLYSRTGDHIDGHTGTDCVYCDAISVIAKHDESDAMQEDYEYKMRANDAYGARNEYL